MPQSTAALRQKAETLRLLRNPDARVAAGPAKGTTPTRSMWARNPLACRHGTCLALQLRDAALWILVRDAQAQEAWAPIARILNPEERRGWAKTGF